MWDKPKAYAVANGHVRGIYDNWPDTAKQVIGFSYNEFRKFYCWDDCVMYLRRKGMTESDFESNCGRSHKEKHDAHKKFYAVVQGRRPGLFTFWGNVKDEVLGYKGSLWGIFECRRDAKQFLKRRGIRDYYRENAQKQIPDPLHNIVFKTDKKGRIEVYVDGAAPNNGLVGATAGIGVWWNDNHALNLAAPVEGDKATNIVAEIQAASAACRIAVEFKVAKLKVCTDSKWLIDCMSDWWPTWSKNGFINAQKKPVENKELLQDLKGLMEKIDVKFKFVAAHTGIKGNEAADALAKEGAAKFPRYVKEDSPASK